MPGCGGWSFAAEHGVATEVFPASAQMQQDGECVALSTEQLITALKEQYAVDYVLLAGYLKVPSTFFGQSHIKHALSAEVPDSSAD